ncbi:MAG TPA: S9 family peptidase [Allosphingosinicella sp.]|jgi:dipeptidyl aminopeptidase/acylaminoacyl peptidase
MKMPLYLMALAAAALPLAAVEAAPAAPRLIPTAALAEQPLISSPSLSPDGTKLLAMLATPGRTRLGLIVVATGEMRLFDVPGEFEIRSYRWAGDGKVLISVGKTIVWEGQDLYMTRLAAYDVATRKSTFIGRDSEGPQGDDIIYLDRSGQWLLLSIQRSVYDMPSVFRVDLVTGSMKEVVHARDDVWNWYADASGVVRAGVGFDNKQWSMVYRAGDGAGFRRVGNASLDAGKDALGLMRFVRDSDDGYILSDAKTGRQALYRYNFATSTLGDLVYQNPTNDVASVALTEDGREVRAAFYTDARDRVEWFDPKMKALQADLDRAVPGKEAWIVSRSRDDSRMLVLVTGANDPGSYFYYVPSEGVMHRLAWRNEKLKGQALAPSRPVTYNARDGLAIQAYLTLPPGRPARGLPLIVLPHGGPFGVRDRGDFDPEVQLLANRGYAVLQPNFRGSESYGRDFEAKGDGQWGRAMQDDLDDGMDWLAAQGIADPKRVCIMGASYGGYAALWGATRNPERYRCAISFAGVSDIGRQLRYSNDYFPNRDAARQWRARVQGQSGFELADVSPLAQAERLRVPVLLAHGSADQRVPPKQSSLYAKALQRAGKTFEYHAYPGEGHGLSTAEDLKDWLDRVEAFLNKYNPPG